ncbi:MAG: T9SS type A sorting domain-containing protein [Bacteroidota bacterium]
MKNTLLIKVLYLFFLFSVMQYVQAQGTPEILYYKFNGSGTTVPNLASSPPSGTSTASLAGSISQGSTGTCSGKALVGTGATSTNDYVNTGWTTSVTGSWTISFWTNNIPSTTTTYYIFGDVTAGSFRCFTGGVAGAGNWILRGPLTDVQVVGAASTSPAVTTFVYDSTAGKIYAYLNGSLVNTVNQTAFSLSGSGPFKVGGYSSSNSLPSGSLMDEFRFYRRALSAAEVAKLRYLGNSYDSLGVTKCGSYLSPTGKTYTTSGFYYDTLGPNYYNCDSIVLTNLTIVKNSTSTLNASSCESYLSPDNKTYTTSGTYTDTIPNAAGCDSIITINLTINKKSSSTISPVSCYKYTSPSGKVYTSSGTYTDTIPNSAGCDSIITINLKINGTTYSSISPSACDSYTSPSGKYTWTASGNYLDTLLNSNGCDSVINVALTINSSSSNIATATACDSYTSPSGKYTWTASGVYLDTLKSFWGCDSILVITLTINKSTIDSIGVTACNSYTGPSGKYSWTTSGIYTDTITNAIGCDSVVIINLTVNYATTSSISPTVCNLYTSPGGKMLITSGKYLDTIPNSVGCDSIISIDLTVNYSSFSTISPTVCDIYTSPSGKVFTASANFIDTIPNNIGCDSLISINLTVNTVNPGISQSGFVLTAAATGATYQWLDCDNSYSVISGETSQSLTVTANGDYAVQVTQNGCTDTSVCISITNVGVEPVSFANGIALYPNPTKGKFTVQTNQPMLDATVKVTSLTGQTVTQKTHVNGNTVELDLSKEAAGIYFVEVADNGNIARIKIEKF